MTYKGIIIKGVGGFYNVVMLAGQEQAQQDHVYVCKPRGRFRLDGVAPRAGDHVLFEFNEATNSGLITEIFPRKNLLTRPPVANVDQFVLVMAASWPRPDFLLSDKLLIQSSRQGVRPIIVMNKSDVADEAVTNAIEREYARLPHEFLMVSAASGEGLDALRKILVGKISCFAGQSAVGKSSILNALCKSYNLETGGLSKKTGRGRHTTRASELMRLEHEADSFVMDTPGFSLLDIEDVKPDELQQYYPEMQTLIEKCRFDDCMHDNEPGCTIKEAVKKGSIPQGRYERYVQILGELLEKEKNRYR